MPKYVLIVDDDKEIQHLIREGLARYRDVFEVVTADDGQAALETLQKIPIALVATDLKMPRMDGLTLLVNIVDHYPEIPVIIITGYGTPQMERVALDGGAVGYLEKPFLIEDLGRRIIGAIGKSSEGGTLHGISSGMFLQLIQMEQKTCTIRMLNKASGREGVLFFLEGELIDARVEHLQGEAAAHAIASWEEVSISIQNECLQKEKRITNDLFTILIEGMRLRDEAADLKAPLIAIPPNSGPSTSPDEMSGPHYAERLRRDLYREIGERCGVESIYSDDSWVLFLTECNRLGAAFSAGDLKLGYVDRDRNSGVFLLSGHHTTAIKVHPHCPRDRIVEVLLRGR
ncbi:MAG: response regulator [Deltaproteobacteria bacterium]|nr:response regulator [Deltaproteobacteria bacterium]